MWRRAKSEREREQCEEVRRGAKRCEEGSERKCEELGFYTMLETAANFSMFRGMIQEKAREREIDVRIDGV